MNPTTYQTLALRTATTHPTWESRMLNWAIGIGGETGEFCDYLKKVIYHGHTPNHDKIVKEAGDILWYSAALADTAEIAFDVIIGDDFGNFQDEAVEGKWRKQPAGLNLASATNKLLAEAGAINAYIDETIFGKDRYNRNTLREMIESFLQHLAMLLLLIGNLSLNNVAERNIEKLRERYPNGFSNQDSINRKDTL